MAAKIISKILVLFLFNNVSSYSVHVKLPEIDFNETDFNEKTHFKYKVVTKACKNRDFCLSNNSRVCAIRNFNNNTQFGDFKNICYLFMSNMCDHPGEEFYIIRSGTCEDYLISRRNEDNAHNDEHNVENDENTDDTRQIDTTPDMLRAKRTTLSTLYDIDSAYDYHACPHSCPDLYSPVCVNVNRGFGKYFKMLNFVNHCEADVYYCKHWREFAPPPDEDENVRSSPLSWSFCGASRYLQFARFAEVTSSLGHYGWLAGDYRFSHIMEPNERLPGHG